MTYYSFPLTSCLPHRLCPRERRPRAPPNSPPHNTAVAQSVSPLSHTYLGLLLLVEQRAIIESILHLVPEKKVFPSPSYQRKAFPIWAHIGQNSKFHRLPAKPPPPHILTDFVASSMPFGSCSLIRGHLVFAPVIKSFLLQHQI